MKQDKIGRVILSVISFLLAMFIVGLGELIKADFKFNFYKDFTFWVQYLTYQIAIVLVQDSNINDKIADLSFESYNASMSLDDGNLAHEVAVRKHTINTLINAEVGPDLLDFLTTEVNRNEKIKVWKHMLQTKRNKISKKVYSRNLKKSAKQQAKLRDIDLKMSDAWINENIDKIQVKYVRVSESYVKSGVVLDSSNGFRKKHHGQMYHITFDTLPNKLMWFGYTMFVTSLIFDSVTFNTTTIWTMTTKFFGLVSTAVSSRAYGVKFISKYTIPELVDRQGLIEAYIKWKMTKAKEVIVNG
jgi:hypothetical protein